MGLPAKIGDADLDLESIQPGMLQIAAGSLGNAATDTDGHDAIFSQAVNAFQAGSIESENLDAQLGAHFVGAVGATSDTLATETQLLAANIDAGTAILAEGRDSISPNPPTPSPATPPPQPPTNTRGSARGTPRDSL